MKLLVNPFFIFLTVTPLFTHAQEAPRSYKLIASVTDSKDPYISFEYTNTSGSAQCVRASDLDFNLHSDDIYVFKFDSSPVKYIGATQQLVDLMPKVFKVLPPGQSSVTGVKLSKFYDIKKYDLIVEYVLPVVSCDTVMQRYINIPPIEFIKANFKITNDIELSKFQSYYPEWIINGFIARSGPITVTRKK